MSDHSRDAIFERQLAERGVAAESILDAIWALPRESFVSERLQPQVYDDGPLPIADRLAAVRRCLEARELELRTTTRCATRDRREGTLAGMKFTILLSLFILAGCGEAEDAPNLRHYCSMTPLHLSDEFSLITIAMPDAAVRREMERLHDRTIARYGAVLLLRIHIANVQHFKTDRRLADSTHPESNFVIRSFFETTDIKSRRPNDHDGYFSGSAEAWLRHEASPDLRDDALLQPLLRMLDDARELAGRS